MVTTNKIVSSIQYLAATIDALIGLDKSVACTLSEWPSVMIVREATLVRVGGPN